MAMSPTVVAQLKLLAARAEVDAATHAVSRRISPSTGGQLAAGKRAAAARQLAAEWNSLRAYAENPATCPPKPKETR